jgi:DoxX-like family
VAESQVQARRVVLGLAGSLVLSALYDAIPNHWFQEEFEDLRLPRWFRFLFVLTKGAAVTGLLVGFTSTRLGRLTTRALVAYFVLAVGAHVRVKDKPVRFIPALAMLAWSAMASRSYPTAQPPST